MNGLDVLLVESPASSPKTPPKVVPPKLREAESIDDWEAPEQSPQVAGKYHSINILNGIK